MKGTKSRMKPKAAHEMERKAKMKEGPTRNAGMDSTDTQVGKEKTRNGRNKSKTYKSSGRTQQIKTETEPKRGVK